MTENQKKQFNLMLTTLKSIAKDYHTSDEIVENCEEFRWLWKIEALCMSYDNMQIEAKDAIKWIKPIK